MFTLFNGQHTMDRALAMADRLVEEYDSMENRIKRAIAEAWGRPAKDAEIAKSLVYIEKMIGYHIEHPPEKQEYPRVIKRKMFEEMTGEPFEFEERLDGYEYFVADLKSWDVDEETRALADLIKVLFNANEFIYVY